MTHEEFDKLVQKVEQETGSRPDVLRKRVAWLAGLGYLSLLGTIGFVLLLGFAFITPGILWPSDAFIMLILGGIVLTVGIGMVVKTFWVKLPPPEGHRLSRDQAPQLYAMLDDLKKSLNSISFDVLLITPDYNASVVQLPRLGAFGWYKNYLLIGLPLMESLSAEEFRAVMAHEFAHLSRRHAQSSQWIYRLRRSWEPIFTKLSKPQFKNEVSFRPLVAKWSNWFWPRFNAHAFVLSRTFEHQADLLSAQLTGNQNASKALARIAMQGRALDRKFWPDLWLQTNTLPEPPNDVFQKLSQFLNQLSAAEKSNFLDQALCSITTNADTHPCLTDRLRALDSSPEKSREGFLSENHIQNAAQSLLGANLEQARAGVQKLFSKECKENWQAQYKRSHALNDRLDKLALGADKKDIDALWDKSQVVSQLQSPEASEPLLREILGMDASHAPANFRLGLLLLKAGKSDGEQHIEKALVQNQEWLLDAANAYHAYFRETGQPERIKALNARMDRFEQTIKASYEERSSVNASDTFIAHQLSDAELMSLRQTLSSDHDIVEAHLACKQLKHFTNQRLFLLCLKIRPLWHHIPSSAREDEIIAKTTKNIRLPGRMMVFVSSGSYRFVARKIRRLPGCQVFGRD